MNFPFRLPAFLLAGLAAALPLAAQTVLDDFSTDQFATNYVQKSVPDFNAGGWNVTGGQLQPDSITTAGGYAAFAWTANSLQNAGDWFSVDISIAGTGGNHNGGLSLWQSNSDTFDRVLEPRLSYDSGYAFVGSDQSTALWADNLVDGVVNGPVTLKVTLTGHDATNTFLSIALSDGDGQIGPVQSYTVANFTGPLYVGPSAWQASGGNVTFDNLTFQAAAIPEPSTYAALAGALVLGFTAWQRRRAAIAA